MQCLPPPARWSMYLAVASLNKTCSLIAWAATKCSIFSVTQHSVAPSTHNAALQIIRVQEQEYLLYLHKNNFKFSSILAESQIDIFVVKFRYRYAMLYIICRYAMLYYICLLVISFYLLLFVNFNTVSLKVCLKRVSFITPPAPVSCDPRARGAAGGDILQKLASTLGADWIFISSKLFLSCIMLITIFTIYI